MEQRRGASGSTRKRLFLFWWEDAGAGRGLGYARRVKNFESDFALNSLRSVGRFCVTFLLSAVLFSACCMGQPPAAAASGMSAPENLALVPMPREVQERAVLSLERGVSVETTSHDADDKFAVTDLVSTLKDRGVDAREGHQDKIRIVLMRLDDKKAADLLAHANVRFDPAMHDEGYVLLTDGSTTYDIAATSAGLYYGAQTLKQLVVSSGASADGKSGSDSRAAWGVDSRLAGDEISRAG